MQKTNILNSLISILSLLILLSPSARATSTNEMDSSTNRLRASEEKVEFLLKELKTLKSASQGENSQVNTESLKINDIISPNFHPDPRCNQNPTCVSQCTARDSRGNCYSYGADFCAPNAQCTAQCEARDSRGNCYSYGPDKCGSNFQCASKCEARDSRGSCYSYGKDFCGPYANCTSNCQARDSRGNCYSYGPDMCY